MKLLNVTLMFDGETEAAFNFYKSVFGGEYNNLQRMSDIPGDHPMPESELNKILHMSLMISNNAVLMGMDVPKGRMDVIKGNNFSLTVHADSREEVEKLYNGLSAGGEIGMPLADQFWGAYFGMFNDKFGIKWMISYQKDQA